MLQFQDSLNTMKYRIDDDSWFGAIKINLSSYVFYCIRCPCKYVYSDASHISDGSFMRNLFKIVLVEQTRLGFLYHFVFIVVVFVFSYFFVHLSVIFTFVRISIGLQ